MAEREFTPERITSLRPNEIFVFGSNLGGFHGGGAAELAYRSFGAVWGQGEGLHCSRDAAIRRSLYCLCADAPCAEVLPYRSGLWYCRF